MEYLFKLYITSFKKIIIDLNQILFTNNVFNSSSHRSLLGSIFIYPSFDHSGYRFWVSFFYLLFCHFCVSPLLFNWSISGNLWIIPQIGISLSLSLIKLFNLLYSLGLISVTSTKRNRLNFLFSSYSLVFLII